mmetsp:Transcript_110753/g.319996  ORF Transcript_110753/g.319996 Transcript_110753/m.319996 type:complete len:549 (+) Transcript_110753:100-1746(+)
MNGIPESNVDYCALEGAERPFLERRGSVQSLLPNDSRVNGEVGGATTGQAQRGRYQRTRSLDTGMDTAKLRAQTIELDGAREISRGKYTWRYNMPDSTVKSEVVHKTAKKASNGEPFRLLRKISGTNTQQHKLNIHRIHHISWLYELYWKDIFHTLVNLKLRRLIVLFVGVYMLLFCSLALAFLWIDRRCDLGIRSFTQAFALSVETWLTIGYGVNDPPGPYFKECPEAVVFITIQGLLGLLMNAFVVGIVITSVSSGSTRGCTVIFSEKAVIREVNGRLFLMMQVCEMRATQLLEAHIRAYVIRRPVPGEVPNDSPAAFELRLVRPDDEIGALMLPVLPSVIVHEIDECSPLGPMVRSRNDPMQSRHWTRPATRHADAAVGSRNGVWCRTCGEQFPTEEMLQAHIAYQAEQDALSGATERAHYVDGPRSCRTVSRSTLTSDFGCEMPISPTTPQSRGATLSPTTPRSRRSWRWRVEDFLASEWFEILVILEGVDTTTAATVQARHSYVAEEIVWDCNFAPIFSLDPKEKRAVINYTLMHDLLPAPPT